MALFGRDALSVFLTRLAQENLRVILVVLAEEDLLD